MQGLGVTPSMTFKTVLIIFGKFIYLFAISLVMGIAFGFAASLLLKKYQPSGLPQVPTLTCCTSLLASSVPGERTQISLLNNEVLRSL